MKYIELDEPSYTHLYRVLDTDDPKPEKDDPERYKWHVRHPWKSLKDMTIDRFRELHPLPLKEDIHG